MPLDAQTILRTIESWRDVARDEVDDIGGWRDADPTARAAWWRKKPVIAYATPPTLDSMFATNTAVILGEMSHLGRFDSTPMQDLLQAVQQWHLDRHGRNLLPQSQLEALLERCRAIIQMLERDAYRRAAPKDLITINVAADLLDCSERTVKRRIDEDCLQRFIRDGAAFVSEAEVREKAAVLVRRRATKKQA